MAITKVTFTGTSWTGNCRDVYNFLTEYATDYFTQISISQGEDEIYCVAHGGLALNLSFDGTDYQRFLLANMQTVANATFTGDSGSKTYVYGYATPYGVLLRDTAGETIFITKSNEDTTVIVGMLTPTESSPIYALYFGDIANNVTWYKPKGNAATVAALRAAHMVDGAANLTTLTPVVLGNGSTYAPHLFITSYSENGDISVPKKLIVDNKEYIYDGLLALEA